MSFEDAKPLDRRNDVSQKIITAILTAVFLGALGFGFRNYEINNMQEVKLAEISYFIKNQNVLNEKLTALLESPNRWGIDYDGRSSRR